jgi:hypothetical protein
LKVMMTRWLACVVAKVRLAPPAAVPLRSTKPVFGYVKSCGRLEFALHSRISALAAGAQRPASTAKAGAATRRSNEPRCKAFASRRRDRMMPDMFNLPRFAGVPGAERQPAGPLGHLRGPFGSAATVGAATA